MDRKFDKWLLFGAGVVVALLIVNAWVTFQSMRSMDDKTRSAVQRYEFLEAAEELAMLLERAELDGRELVASSDLAHAGDFLTTTEAIDAQMQRVQATAQGLTPLPEELAEIDESVKAWMGQLDGAMVAGLQNIHGGQPSSVAMAERKGFEAIRRKLDRIEAEQRRILLLHQDSLGMTSRGAVVTSLLTTLLGIVTLAAFVHFLRRFFHTRKTAEDLLRTDREWFCDTLGSIGAGVIATDSAGRVKFLNGVSESLTGIRASDGIAQPLPTIFHVEPQRSDAPGDTSFVEMLLRGEQEHLMRDLTLTSRNGTQRTIAATGALIRDSQGGRNGAVLVFGDVTQQREYEAALKKQQRLLETANDTLESRVQERTGALARANTQLAAARDAAEAGNRAKSMFLANMSHEIRTPLNAVIGMTELALKGRLSLQQREYLNTVRDSGEALLAIISDILDFSKIEAGRMALDFEAFDLRESLGDTLKSFAIRAGQKGLELVCRIAPELPRRVVGDYHRLRQIVMNLVANAIKFTEKGEVLVEVRLESTAPAQWSLHFIVSDTGIGIPDSRQSAIFEIFEQADSTTTRRYGGAGLGLAIASRLVELMQGHIWVESEVGRGTAFHFTAVFGEAEADSQPVEEHTKAFSGIRVLIVDDNETARSALADTLAGWHMRVDCADAVSHAADIWATANNEGDPIRVAFCDGSMPGIGDFVQSMAAQTASTTHKATTLVSLGGGREAAEDAVKNGNFLLKPLKESEIHDTIASTLGMMDATVPVAPTARNDAPHLDKLKILLAEDSLVNRQLALALLRGDGHDVLVACTGTEAVADIQRQSFDIVLMDVQMPEMDGLEATALVRLRERSTGGHVPIIAMTAHALKGDRERCLAAGMDGYISKPIRADDMFATIASTLTKVTMMTKHTVDASPTDVSGTMPQNDADAAEVARSCEGNPRLIGLVTEAAVEEIPRLLTNIHDAIDAGDAVRLRLEAHTLKGSLGYFGTTAAYEAACRMEKLGMEGEFDTARAAFAALEEASRHLARILGEFTCSKSTNHL